MRKRSWGGVGGRFLLPLGGGRVFQVKGRRGRDFSLNPRGQRSSTGLRGAGGAGGAGRPGGKGAGGLSVFGVGVLESCAAEGGGKRRARLGVF